MEAEGLIDKVFDWISDHSGTICSGIAVAGVFATAYFSGKAAVRVDHTIDPDLDTEEKIKEYAKAYWKTGLAAGLTCGAIIGSDRIHVGKEAALAGVAALWKKREMEANKALVDAVGREKAIAAQKEVKEASSEQLLDSFASMNSKLYVYEPYTDQYFYTTRETIAWTMLEANKMLAHDFEVKLNTVIKMLGGKPDPSANNVGWNWENESQDYAWGYFGGPWIELNLCVHKHGEKDALCLFYMVDPEEQTPEAMIYKEET